MKLFYESLGNALLEPMGSVVLVYILGIISKSLVIISRGGISYKCSQTCVLCMCVCVCVCVHSECSVVLFKGRGTIMKYNKL